MPKTRTKKTKEERLARDEYQTPNYIINTVRDVFNGVIDLDPASSRSANLRIRAKSFYSKEDSGLGRYWLGNVWLNPPYSIPLVNRFIQQALDSYFEFPSTSIQGILVFDSSTVRWKLLFPHLSALCLLHKRVAFLDPQTLQPQDKNASTQAVFLLSRDRGTRVRFNELWARYGTVLS